MVGHAEGGLLLQLRNDRSGVPCVRAMFPASYAIAK